MIRRKVAERLQARKRASSGSVRASDLHESTPDTVFSASVTATTGKPRLKERTSSEGGFLFVDDRDAHSDSADDIEDHEAICQAVAGDDISGFDVPGVLLDDESVEESGTVSLEDSPPPRQKPVSPSDGRVRAGAMSFTSAGDDGLGGKGGLEESVTSQSSKPAVKPWQMTSDKDIYEQQLMLMQEQLTTAMIEKEELKSM